MLSDALVYLECPLCGSGFTVSAGSMNCAEGHAFDIARQGYVNLATGAAKSLTADTAAMVHARADFLRARHYEPIAEAVADVAERCVTGAEGPRDGCVVDAGAGTGYYLARVLEALPGRVGIALDISKHAARRAARAHDRAAAVVCDTWGRLPLRDGSAALVLDVFAPRNAAEFRRALAPGGALIVVTPSARHLCELVGPLGLLSVDEHKDERLADQLAGSFVQRESELIEWTMSLSRADVLALVRMGPSAWHADASTLAARVTAMPEPLPVTASVYVSAYVPAQAPGRAGAV